MEPRRSLSGSVTSRAPVLAIVAWVPPCRRRGGVSAGRPSPTSVGWNVQQTTASRGAYVWLGGLVPAQVLGHQQRTVFARVLCSILRRSLCILRVGGFDPVAAMVAKQTGVLPVGLKMHDTPAIGAGSCPDAGAFRFAAFMAQSTPIVGYGVERVTARPGVGMGTELIH